MVKVTSNSIKIPQIVAKPLIASNELFHLNKKAFNSEMPFGFYYNVDIQHAEPNGIEAATADYRFFSRLCRYRNSRSFLQSLKDKRGKELIQEFEVQLFHYSKRIQKLTKAEQKNELAKWFSFTEHLLNEKAIIYFEGLENVYANYEFEKWRNTKEHSSKTTQLKRGPLPAKMTKSSEFQKIDLNVWNAKGKDVFEYLVSNYAKSQKKQKFINIYHFLKGIGIPSSQNEIYFKYTANEYITEMRKMFQIDLKKMNQTTNYEAQKIVLDGLYLAWKRSTAKNSSI